jgi:formylglycine-generating enzyme required for sulfatase activity
LALEVHERQRGQRERDDGPADITEGEVLVAFKPLLGEIKPEVLVAYLQHRAGLLAPPREGVYAFPHRSFQEYLAACRLANAPEAAQGLRDKVCEDLGWWREVFLLGVGKTRQGGLGNAAQVINVLLPDAVDDAADRKERHFRLAVLAAQALLELRLAEKAPGEAHYQALLKRTRGWLVAAIEEGVLAPSERLQAGDILGRLGDPRFDEKVFHLPKRYQGAAEPLFGFVHVPAGPFTMGSAQDDELAYDDERPAHTLDLPGFHIARYPVTNAQYRCFVEAGGYEQREYWTEAGWAWRRGAEADLGPIDDEDIRRRYAEWFANRPAEKRSQPYYWDQPPWNAATRPVVGVCWYEAMAYCRWLAEKLEGPLRARGRLDASARCVVRLPTEAEWEKAARGTDGRRWPWGDAWQEGCATTAEAKLEQTSPVGMFPAGQSPCEALNMAGNVWEWTSSRWGRTSVFKPDYGYPYRPDDGREAPDGPDLRVVRGGSWIDDRRNARCAVRDWAVPDYFLDFVGFRVVLSLANSES